MNCHPTKNFYFFEPNVGEDRYWVLLLYGFNRASVGY